MTFIFEKSLIKEKYPITEQIRIAFKEFHDTIFSNDESKIDDYIETYKNILPSFCKAYSAFSFSFSTGVFLSGN